MKIKVLDCHSMREVSFDADEIAEFAKGTRIKEDTIPMDRVAILTPVVRQAVQKALKRHADHINFMFGDDLQITSAVTVVSL